MLQTEELTRAFLNCVEILFVMWLHIVVLHSILCLYICQAGSNTCSYSDKRVSVPK